MENKLFLIANKIQTPDGTILWSRHVHDNVMYRDTVTNEIYMIDGGTDYIHSTINQIKATDLCVYSDAPFEVIRENLLLSIKYQIFVPLSKANDLHITSILDEHERKNIKSDTDIFLEKELEYRKQKNIKISQQYSDEDLVPNIINKK